MTLLGVKPSTRDIDFTGKGDDIRLFKRTCRSIPHGMKIDTYADGLIFQTQLPDDYLTRSRKVESARQFKRIRLKALHPLDIVVTKIGRLDDRDKQDIKDCIRKFRLKKSDVKLRASQVDYIGVTEHFEHHLHLVLSRFFR